MALENVGSFQYLCIKYIRKNTCGPEKIEGSQFFINRGPSWPWNFWLISIPGAHRYFWMMHLILPALGEWVGPQMYFVLSRYCQIITMHIFAWKVKKGWHSIFVLYMNMKIGSELTLPLISWSFCLYFSQRNHRKYESGDLVYVMRKHVSKLSWKNVSLYLISPWVLTWRHLYAILLYDFKGTSKCYMCNTQKESCLQILQNIKYEQVLMFMSKLEVIVSLDE